MRAIVVREPGDECVLALADVPSPPLGDTDVRIRVRATGAVQRLREAGAASFVTAGSDEKCRRCEALGATAAINYRTADFAARVRELTTGRGVDVVLDHLGAAYLEKNLAALAVGGRLV